MLSTINRIEQCYYTAAAGVCYGGGGVATHLHLYQLVSIHVCIVAYHTCNTEKSTPNPRGHIVSIGRKWNSARFITYVIVISRVGGMYWIY